MNIAILGPVCRDIITIDGRRFEQLGGIPYYVALTLKRLGVEEVVPYITYGIGDETWVMSHFDSMNVRGIPVDKTLTSVIAYSTDNPDIRTHTIYREPNTIVPTNELLAELERFDHVILAPLLHDDIPFELFSRLGHKSLIHGNFGMFTYGEDGQFVRKHPENLVRVLPFLRYLFLDDNEAMFVSGTTTVDDAATFLLGNGLTAAAITMGSKGSRLYENGRTYHIPAFPPHRLADPTGAGDTYLSAYIRALELFDDPQRRGEFASMAATMSIEHNGAFTADLPAVLNRLREITA